MIGAGDIVVEDNADRGNERGVRPDNGGCEDIISSGNIAQSRACCGLNV